MPAPIYWEPKDPDETLNYAVIWTLAEGDTVTASSWSNVTGATLEADGIGAGGLSTTARVSGGVDGVPASLLNTVETAQGETLEQVVILPIISSSVSPLGDYETPRPQDLTARYPAFAEVPYSTISAHIQDALTGADSSWNVADYPKAIMALAAHNMALLGIGDTDEVTGYARKGVTSLRDGAFAVSISDKAASKACDGTYASTPYGQQYHRLLRKNKGGPRLVGGAAAGGGWGPLAQQNNGAILPWSDY